MNSPQSFNTLFTQIGEKLKNYQRVLNTLTSVCLFSILFSIYLLWYWQGEFTQKSRASSVRDHSLNSHHLNPLQPNTGREIAPNTGPNAPKFFTLATKSWKLVAKLATRTFHHNLTKRYSELKRFAKINPRQTSSLSLFPKRSTCISIDN